MAGSAGPAPDECATGALKEMELSMSPAVFPTATSTAADVDWSDRDVLRHLRCWREAMMRVRALGIRSHPLDPDRYWHYFACTD